MNRVTTYFNWVLHRGQLPVANVFYGENTVKATLNNLTYSTAGFGTLMIVPPSTSQPLTLPSS